MAGQARRVVDLDRLWRNGVAVADVDVHRQACAGDLGQEVQPHPAVFILSAGGRGSDGVWPKNDAVVFDRHVEDFVEHLGEVVGRVFAIPQKIEIAGGARG